MTHATDIPAEQIPGQLDALEVEPGPEPYTMRLPVRIVVLQRGWVVVGRIDKKVDEDGNVTELIVFDAQVIRRWGTTRGLGELVDGPKPNTVLDPAGTVFAHPLAVVLQIAVAPAAWQGHLK